MKYAKDQRYDESGIATHCGQVGLKKSMQTTKNFAKSKKKQKCQLSILFQVLPAVSADKLSELQEVAG